MARAGKTHKAMAKRVKVSKNNKLIHRKACKSHLLTNKGRTTKKDKYGKEIHKSEQKRVKRMIGVKMR